MICYDLRPEENGRSHLCCPLLRHVFAVLTKALDGVGLEVLVTDAYHSMAGGPTQ